MKSANEFRRRLTWHVKLSPAGRPEPKFMHSVSFLTLQLGICVVLFANDARRDLSRFDRDGLVDDPLLVRVVAHLDIARDREVLAERVTDEAVVREQTAQIRMTREDDTEQVESFALQPVR